jgi:excisionase family DNA binding protein
MHRDQRPVIPIPSGWMSIPEAAVYMKCTKSYVHRITREREIPFSKAGKRYILSQRDCDAHLEQIKLPVGAPGQDDDDPPHRKKKRGSA